MLIQFKIALCTLNKTQSTILTYPIMGYIKTGYSYPIKKLNYARGGCRRECEMSLPRLSKWANSSLKFIRIKGSNEIMLDSMVWIWQQWQLQNGEHMSAAPWSWFPSMPITFSIFASSLDISPSLHGMKLRAKKYSDNMIAIDFTMQR